ncbi:MAG TPA: hypothetical protein VGB83_03820 [Actinomycetota bacterium]
MATYGEHMLAQAERRGRARSARRRRVRLLWPSLAMIFWSLADLLAARHERTLGAGVGPAGQLVDHVQPIAWTVLLVAVPLVASLKPQPVKAGALLALLAGPVFGTAIFGTGGWRWWQATIVGAACLLILAASNPSPQPSPAG